MFNKNTEYIFYSTNRRSEREEMLQEAIVVGFILGPLGENSAVHGKI